MSSNNQIFATVLAGAAAMLSGPKRFVALAAAALLVLPGCAAVPGKFDNRVLHTMPCDRAFVGILFGDFGITLELSAKDVPYACRQVVVPVAQFVGPPA